MFSLYLSLSLSLLKKLKFSFFFLFFLPNPYLPVKSGTLNKPANEGRFQFSLGTRRTKMSAAGIDLKL
jgi:hypothetical protein